MMAYCFFGFMLKTNEYEKYFRIAILILLFSIQFNSSYCQQNQKRTETCQIQFEFEEYSLYGKEALIDDTMKFELLDSSIVTILLKSCQGKAWVHVEKEGIGAISSGYYINSLDTLKKYVGVYDQYGDIIKYTVHSYFKPLRHGLWNLNDEKYSKIILYDLGVVESSKYLPANPDIK